MKNYVFKIYIYNLSLHFMDLINANETIYDIIML